MMQAGVAQEQTAVVTLRKVWRDYLRSRDLKTATVRNYSQRLSGYLGDWLDMPITAITKDMIEERHRSIPAKAMGNSVFRTLRALLHYAAAKYEDEHGRPILSHNPVRRLAEIRGWHRDRRRKTYIKPNQMAAWFKSVLALDDRTTRDLMITLLLTGMRKCEALALKWDNVDLDGGTITLLDTKNGEDFTLPLSKFLWRLLRVRRTHAKSEYVFPGRFRGAHLTSVEKAVRLINAESGVRFSLHDLRRTFITIGDELDLKNEVIKALVNHRPKDVTEGYIVRSTERLRRATEMISAAILKYGRVRTD